MRGQRHAPAAPYPRERPGTRFTGGWVGLRAGLDRCGIPRPPPGIDPRTAQPVGKSYTEYVALVIQQAKRMRLITLSSMVSPALPSFSTLSHKRHDFMGKKLLNIMCVHLFSL